MSRLLYKDNSLKFLYLESQLEGTQIKFRNCGREKQFKTALVNRPKYSQILVDFLGGGNGGVAVQVGLNGSPSICEFGRRQRFFF